MFVMDTDNQQTLTDLFTQLTHFLSALLSPSHLDWISFFPHYSSSSMLLWPCRWSSLLWETTSSTGTTLWARMSPSCWRSGRRCRMPSSNSLQGTRHVAVHAVLSWYWMFCGFFLFKVILIICVRVFLCVKVQRGGLAALLYHSPGGRLCHPFTCL